MARDPLVVAAEEAAVMRVRVETALAKAIAASDRLALVPAELAAVTTGGVEEQQQGNLKNIQKNNMTRNAVNHFLGPVNPAMSDFMRNFQRVQREHKEQREREQQRQQQQQQEQQQQQQPPARLADYHDWAAANLPQSGTTTPAAAAAAAATTNNNRQQQQHQGKATFSIISYLTETQTTYPPGLVKERVASIEEQAASPPHGVDPRTLASGLPPDQDSDSDSNVFELATNTSTGSATVDHLEVRLEEEDMDDSLAPDGSLIQGAARMEDS
jgi:hypothetical protein